MYEITEGYILAYEILCSVLYDDKSTDLITYSVVK